MDIDAKYFKEYRLKLGFTNQNNLKNYLSAKDLRPNIDYDYLNVLDIRLKEILIKLNNIVDESIKFNDINLFCKKNIDEVHKSLADNNILPKLNNQGRRPEQVYFSWVRGYAISTFFLKSMSNIFDTDIKNISLIGDDDLTNIETFKRTPKADLEITLSNKNKLRIEVQSGFQGINDIKQHKVLEAKRIKREFNISSIVAHFDIFNGQVAFVQIDDIDDNNINWITRQQMEGQTVFNIDQNNFIWKITEKPPLLKELNIKLFNK
ncbi:restriction endonuclease [Ornithobacterium rhinotracheale]|uniref:restriction endonuclease n=1 Tax=Ornithobacterium rhinotracheale TaxID=28251 RepID=UPI00129CC295|nr:restriction endonuclease [Ornithobacterium rhinotracheale]MRJ09549.1 restriction endonuclease [Ornithobacterium rhinotracheale]